MQGQRQDSGRRYSQEEQKGSGAVRRWAYSNFALQTAKKLTRDPAYPAQESLGRDPVHLAAEQGDIEILRQLKKYLAIEKFDEPLERTGERPLHAAAKHGHMKIVEFLIEECKVNPNPVDNQDKTPLHLALRAHEKLALWLLKHLIKKQVFNAEARTKSNESYFFKAGVGKSKKALKALKKAGVDPRISANSGEAPLHLIAQGGTTEMLDFILRALIELSGSNDLEPRITSNSHTPLHELALPIDTNSKELIEKTRLLVKNGANLSVQTSTGDTVFHLAAKEECLEILSTIIELASLDCLRIRNSSNETFLDIINNILRQNKSTNQVALNNIKKLAEDTISSRKKESFPVANVIYKKEFLKGKSLAHGGFGEVSEGIFRGRRVAIKMPIRKKFDQKKIKKISEIMRQEAKLLKGLKHPNVIKMFGYCLEKCAIIMELMEPTTLYDLIYGQSKETNGEKIRIKSEFPWRLRAKMIDGIAKGLDYLHSKGIIHRDLKPENIFTKRTTGEEEDIIAVIGDLGLSKKREVLTPGKASATTLGGNIGGGAGSDGYRAPELINPELLKLIKPEEKRKTKRSKKLKATHTRATDIWAFSVMVKEIVTRTEPFSGENFRNIINGLFESKWIGKRMEPTPNTPKGVVELVSACEGENPLDPKTRITAAEVAKRANEIYTNCRSRKSVSFMDCKTNALLSESTRYTRESTAAQHSSLTTDEKHRVKNKKSKHKRRSRKSSKSSRKHHSNG